MTSAVESAGTWVPDLMSRATRTWLPSRWAAPTLPTLIPATITWSLALMPAVLGNSAVVSKVLEKTPLWRNRAPAVNTRMMASAMVPMM